ncbi:GNAT family N-acetyltransferase [Candidatus Woesearchaeota archaeon]|nr:GNAT family N-acetyltransferase [Candidatus Woesearchaeota archaeon]
MNKFYEPYAKTKKAFDSNGLFIMPSGNGDLEGIVKLKYAIFNELCPRLSAWYNRHPEVFESEFRGPNGQDLEKRVFYTVKRSEEVVGCGGLIQKNPKKEPMTGEITDIYLIPELRGKGLGKALVSDLIQKAGVLGFEKLFLTTRKEFKAATQLYQRLGFMQVPNEKYKSNNSTSWELRLKY